MKHRIAVAVIVILVLVFPGVSAKADEQCGILFLTSIDPDQSGLAALIDETRSEIQTGIDRPVHFDLEYLDPELFMGAREKESKAVSFLQVKYAHQHFDMVIAIGSGPLEFARKYGPRLFSGARIVWLRQSLSAERGPAVTPGETGIRALLNFTPTLDAAMAQNPGLRQIVLVAGSSPDDQLKLQEARNELETFAPKPAVLELTGNSVADLKSRLKDLGPHSVILFLDLTADSAGDEYISERVLPELARAANRPMYGTSREQVGKGVVGGSVIDMREVGRVLGKTTLRVLRGEKPDDVPVASDAFQRYVFDAREMKRWGIRYVPPGSEILNQGYGAWDLYKWKLIGLSLAVFVETVLIVLLIRMSVQRRRAERELARTLTVQELESSLAATLIQLPAEMASAAIDRGFKHFIEFFGIDCISLFEYLEDKSQFQLLHYRCTPNTPLRMSRLKPEQFQWTADQLLQGRPVVVRTRADVPQEAASVMSAVFDAGLRSLAGVPLMAANKVFGALFFSSSRERDWDARLVEELQTIANIMGNGLQRARVQAGLTQSEQLKTAILASLPSLVAVLDAKGNITPIKSSAVKFASEASIGRDVLRPGVNYFEVCKRAGEKGSRAAAAALRGLQEVCSRASRNFELEYRSPHAPAERWFQMSAVPLIGKQGGVVVSHTDVTERKLAELDLRESERRFRLMADSAPILMWMSGPDRLCTDFNKAWLDFTGNRLEDELGEGWVRGVHPDDVQRCLAGYNSAFDARMAFSLEYRLRRFDGQYRWMADRGVPRFRSDGTFAGYIGCCVDLTEQKEAELARAEIGGRLILAQEEERARIARELHDDINQKLGLLAIDIQQLQQRLPGLGDEAQSALTALFHKTNRVSADVQRLSHQLHSSRLDYLGLPAALRRLCEEFAAQHKIATECVIRDTPAHATREINLCLFRVAQECLNNTAKHSAARHVKVELRCDETSICLTVSDDGKGFDSGARREPGLGLVSMRERLRLVNGEILIQSQKGTGTNVVAVVPLKQDGSVMQNVRSNIIRMAG